jgi:hypothetical protein
MAPCRNSRGVSWFTRISPSTFLHAYLKQNKWSIWCHLRTFQWSSHDDVHPLLVYTTWLGLYIPNDKIPSAVVLFNAPASFEKERTLSKMLEQHGSSKISVIPSIHEWGGRRDGFYVDRSDKEPPSTTFIIRMESSHSTFPWAPLFCVCARISTHHPVTRAWTARKVSSKPLEWYRANDAVLANSQMDRGTRMTRKRQHWLLLLLENAKTNGRAKREQRQWFPSYSLQRARCWRRRWCMHCSFLSISQTKCEPIVDEWLLVETRKALWKQSTWRSFYFVGHVQPSLSLRYFCVLEESGRVATMLPLAVGSTISERSKIRNDKRRRI